MISRRVISDQQGNLLVVVKEQVLAEHAVRWRLGVKKLFDLLEDKNGVEVVCTDLRGSDHLPVRGAGSLPSMANDPGEESSQTYDLCVGGSINRGAFQRIDLDV